MQNGVSADYGAWTEAAVAKPAPKSAPPIHGIYISVDGHRTGCWGGWLLLPAGIGITAAIAAGIVHEFRKE